MPDASSAGIGRTTHLSASWIIRPPRDTHKSTAAQRNSYVGRSASIASMEAPQDLNNLSASRVRTGLSEQGFARRASASPRRRDPPEVVSGDGRKDVYRPRKVLRLSAS
jgi:hypothetical protein